MGGEKVWSPGEVCEHGKLGRQCEVCELTAEVARLTAARDVLAGEVRALRAHCGPLSLADKHTLARLFAAHVSTQANPLAKAAVDAAGEKP